MKILILGCGKRFCNVYYKILQGLNHELFVWNRTIEKSQKFCEENNCKIVKDLSKINDINPDLIVCFIPPQFHYEFLTKINFANGRPILLETPAIDSRLMSIKNLGVLEQWPKLPLEQFKEKIYSSELISRPYIMHNDGRSFDYHAMAQLRCYSKFQMPVNAKGSSKAYKNAGQIDAHGKLNTTPHEWTVGQIEMSDGGLIIYNFAYNCKSLLSIPIQFLRAYSIDGSIITGRMKEVGNDYEFIDIRYVDKLTKETKISDVIVKRENDVTISIQTENISWNNPFSKLGFDDQQSAIATLIEEALDSKFYTYQNAYVDNICINMIKQASYQQQVIKIQ